MEIKTKPSPNHNFRPTPEVSLVVVHGTVGSDAGDLNWLTNPAAKVSYHYLIQRDGTIWRLVEEKDRAWHAGKSHWHGRDDVNDFSIGIGLSNLGPGKEEHYTDEQYDSLGWLIHDLFIRYGPLDVVGHKDVSPGRKTDPWDYFDWNSMWMEAGKHRGQVPRCEEPKR